MSDATMTNAKIAIAFTDLLKANQHQEAAKRFNAEDIVSYEPMEGPMAVCRGRAQLEAKSQWWYANHETHGGTVEGPYLHGDQFALHFTIDITVKATGQRIAMQELGLYTIKDGKIAEERFFYAQG